MANQRSLRGVAAAAAFALVAGLSGAAAAQEAPRFALPVDCEIGTVCTIQNYVDMEPGPEARDQTCGPLTYDGHGGVDFRVPTMVEMRDGVAVVAAAAGVVKGRRDGMEDISVREVGRESLQGRDAGNGVVIDHGNGWETQYSHMRRGSVAVQVGQQVAAGDKLGLIGLSGNTEFPHLHFSVRHNGVKLDPFTGLEPGAGCGKASESLWQDATRQLLDYQAGGLLAAGFSDRKVELDELIDGAARETTLPDSSPVLAFWAVAWGLRGGDNESITLLAPDGSVVAETTNAIPRDKAQWYSLIGRKVRGESWPAGTYRGLYKVTREVGADRVTVIDIERELEVR